MLSSGPTNATCKMLSMDSLIRAKFSAAAHLDLLQADLIAQLVNRCEVRDLHWLIRS